MQQTDVAKPSSSHHLGSRVGPSVLAGSMVGGVALLAVRDPNTSGSYGVCPFKALTGWDCPFCGGLRGTYSLIHGDVPTALDHNILLPVIWAGLITAVVVWWRRTGSSTPSSTGRVEPDVGTPRGSMAGRWVFSRPVLIATAILLVGFWVVRNLPAFPYLGSAAG
ncbi:MAG TPA: DUF2752 domain-containing protein [Actinomycetes bacterium]|nr:DUF2752 domain-containing protein [Actinomycetes bacterium]